MLRLYRRHRLMCGHRSERYRRCQCPIYVEGSLAGEQIRKSLDLTSWEAASDLIIVKWNAAGQIGAVRVEIPIVRDAVAKHIADAEARNLQPASVNSARRDPAARVQLLLVKSHLAPAVRAADVA